jgi:hypothetical protein
LVADSPKEHRFISEWEKNYLIENTKKEVSARECGNLVAIKLDFL